MYFNAIRENKILAKNSSFTVDICLKHMVMRRYSLGKSICIHECLRTGGSLIKLETAILVYKLLK